MRGAPAKLLDGRTVRSQNISQTERPAHLRASREPPSFSAKQFPARVRVETRLSGDVQPPKDRRGAEEARTDPREHVDPSAGGDANHGRCGGRDDDRKKMKNPPR